MKCPHCDEDIDTVTRTGERRYSCGECNMVISYDQLEPHLDELEVIDKRGSVDNSSDSNNQDSDEGGRGIGGDSQPRHDLNEREIIYQRGTEGLKQIKKARLKNWLANTEGVGSQTEQRILMVFDRNDSVHRDPNVLYNLLGDELSASPSYINTMVQDVFAPERQHEDLLSSEGFTPWFNRPGLGSGTARQQGQPQAMTSGGQTQFQPTAGGQQQQTSSDAITSMDEDEAGQIVEQAIEKADEGSGSNPVREGLSEATDEALRKMAQNVGGLAGTIQRVIDEALVSYARENPEWVIENMDIIQKFVSAAEGAEAAEESPEEQISEQDKAVDEAVEGIRSEASVPSAEGSEFEPAEETLEEMEGSGDSSSGLESYNEEKTESETTAQESSPESEAATRAEARSSARRKELDKSRENEEPDEENKQEEETWDELFGDIEEAKQ